jgi:uncharacterized protein DUF1353
MTVSRRDFLLTFGVISSPFFRPAYAQMGQSGHSVNGSEPYADKEAADRWMRQWMEAPKAVNKPLHVGRFADRMYFLIKEIGWEPNAGQQGKAVQVDIGFVTDFASIPRVFWSILPPDGLYTYPAIIHDYLYWEQPVSRDNADLVLKYAMEDFKIDKATIEAVYRGVRFGGGSAWDENAKLKAAGEKRILKKWPEDPTIRWSDWKKRPDVF